MDGTHDGGVAPAKYYALSDQNVAFIGRALDAFIRAHGIAGMNDGSFVEVSAVMMALSAPREIYHNPALAPDMPRFPNRDH